MDTFLSHLISRFDNVLSPETCDHLLRHKNIYVQAFTVGDYEVFEQIGDAILGNFIVGYSYRRFPYLNCKEGVKIVARIRIKYTSCAFLSEIAEHLNFWPHIVGAVDMTSPNRRQNLLEDVFEAFIGATGYIIDRVAGEGTGFIVCNAILTSIFDDFSLDLSYQSLFDTKTRLKELCDYYKQRLQVSWESEKQNEMLFVRLLCKVDNEDHRFTASARTKADAEQGAANEALIYLAAQGIQKPVPDIYTTLK